MLIEKIRGILQLKELITGLTKQVNHNEKSVEDLSGNITKLQEHVSDLSVEIKTVKKSKEKYMEGFDSESKRVKETADRLNNCVNSINLALRQMPNDIFHQLRQEMDESIKKVKLELDSYNNLKKEMSGINSEVKETRKELNKFKEISSKLKSADFDLTKYQKILEENDREKLQLMKKIDTLERLISKMRRSR